MANDATNISGGPALKKRSLFNKPSWSKPQTLSNGADLFHRSNHAYVDLVAEVDRERKGSLARKERERARREGSEARSGKRRRISSDEDEYGGSSSDQKSHYMEGKKVTHSSDKKNNRENTPLPASPQKARVSPKSLLERYEAAIDARVLDIEKKLKAKPSKVIDLEDDEEALKIGSGTDNLETIIVNHPRLSEDDDQPASDEEFPELARQAREKARRKRLEADIVSTTPEPSPSAGSNGPLQRFQSLYQSTPPPPPPPDPVLQILITSSIPNTEPLIVNRRLSQRLKEVRVTWAQRQHFTPEFAETVFLTWRGRRLFDVASCKSCGITVDSNGNIRVKGDSLEELNGQIHMEAMTAEIFEAYRKAKTNDAANGAEGPIQEPVIEEKKEPQLRIILKAKGFDDFKLMVKSSTLVSKMITAFRLQNQISSERKVHLMFDGDKLSPESQVGDTELSDMDTLDVLIK